MEKRLGIDIREVSFPKSRGTASDTGCVPITCWVSDKHYT